ncbi:MAG: TetR/AcrR family transcriptional regulator [Polyangiales bacterium]
MNGRFRKRSEERQRAITDAVIEEVAARGFEGAAVASIAERAGMSKASLFYYFVDRDELLATGLERWFSEHAAGGAIPTEALTSGSFWTAFEAMYQQRAEKVATQPTHVRFARAWITLVQQGTTSPLLAPWVDRARAMIESVLELGITQGAVRSDLPRALLSRAVLSMALTADGWMTEQLSSGANPSETVRVVLALFRSAFEASEQPTQPLETRLAKSKSSNCVADEDESADARATVAAESTTGSKSSGTPKRSEAKAGSKSKTAKSVRSKQR